METVTLSNGMQMPAVGFGTWKAPSDEITVNAVKTAVECGYTHIDAAAAYHNEIWVGKGIRESGIKREDLFLTSKLWNDDHGYESTLRAFENTITDLGVDYLDLYLIHWPVPVKFHDNYIEKNRETWKAFEELYKAGKVKAIGVSNFKPHHIDEILEVCEIPPNGQSDRVSPKLSAERDQGILRRKKYYRRSLQPSGERKSLSM